MDAVEEIKNRLAIEDVIGEYVQLKRMGRNWRGLSPFTNEHTPSFMVSPEKQIWHDFSSGKGGNVFSFVMEMEGLEFKEALELLARKAGLDLAEYRIGQTGSNSKLKERLYEALEWATKFYQTQFSHNRTALEYILRTRQFSKATALEWRLGYAPTTGTALVTFLKSKHFTDDEIKRAGLSSRNYRGLGDMFRGRIMIPLTDQQGRIIGFTARLLFDEPKAPKYINTPQTLLYDKSRHVFGLHLAKEAIRKQNYVVVTEGNLDVITSHQAGVRAVVATAGTAVTAQHLKTLSRFTCDIRLSFDVDAAGLAAAERAIPIASKVGVSLSMVTIPSGKDPDDLIKQSPEKWRAIIERPQYALDWLIARYQKLLDLTSSTGKRQFSDIMLGVIRDLQDPVEQEHYLELVGRVIGVSQEALQSKLQTGGQVPLRKLKTAHQRPAVSDKAAAELAKAQDHFMSLMLHQPHLRDFLPLLIPDMLPSETARTLLMFLQAKPDFAGDATSAKPLQPIGDYVKILVLQYEALYQDVDSLELRYEAARLQTRLIEHYVKTQKLELSHQLQDASDAKTQTLLEKVKQFDILLNQVKES